MKATILLLFTLALSVSGMSQSAESKGTTSGKITYLEKVKLEIKLEGDAAQFADALPKEQSSYKVLSFNPECSLYQADASRKEEDVMSQQSGHMSIRMVKGGADNRTYCDFLNKRKTEQKEFMTRMFLVESDLVPVQWKISNNFKIMLGYNCQEALSTDTTRMVRAWFTTSIPVSTGPAGYGGLPGLILMVDIDNGKQIITATAIDPSLPGTLIKPDEGKKVTKEEFKKIVDEKMKEIGSENGEGTNHVIIRYKN